MLIASTLPLSCPASCSSFAAAAESGGTISAVMTNCFAWILFLRFDIPLLRPLWLQTRVRLDECRSRTRRALEMFELRELHATIERRSTGEAMQHRREPCGKPFRPPN